MISSRTIYYFVRVVRTVSFLRSINLKVYTTSNGKIQLKIVGSRLSTVLVDTATISSLISAIYIFYVCLIRGIQSKRILVSTFSLLNLLIVQFCLFFKVFIIICRKELVEFINSYFRYCAAECEYLIELLNIF